MTFADLRLLIDKSVNAWIDDYAPSMGAAIAYYTLFSIAPLLILLIAVAGYVFGEDAAQGEIVFQLQGRIGYERAEVVQSLINTCDELIIGGGMANTFIKARGGQTGASLVEDDLLETARTIIKKAADKGVKLHIPTDAVVADAFAETANTDQCAGDAVPDGWMALDIGPKSIEAFRTAVLRSKTLLWIGSSAGCTAAVAASAARAAKHNGGRASKAGRSFMVRASSKGARFPSPARLAGGAGLHPSVSHHGKRRCPPGRAARARHLLRQPGGALARPERYLLRMKAQLLAVATAAAKR